MYAGFSIWRQSLAMATLIAESNSVIALRVMGMAGLWPVPQGENARMVNEKTPAFVESWFGANAALMAGKGTEAVVTAWTRPLTRKARANRRRLSRHK